MVSLPYLLPVFRKLSTSKVLAILSDVAEVADELRVIHGGSIQWQHDCMGLLSRRYLPRYIERTNILHSINLWSDAGLCSVGYGLLSSLGSKLRVLRRLQSLSLLPWCTGLPGSPRSSYPGHSGSSMQ